MKEFLDDTDLFIKDNLDWILAGNWDHKFDKAQLDKMIELSFLYNHLRLRDDKLTFEYSKWQINLGNLYKRYSELVYQMPAKSKEGVKNMIITTITSQDGFKLAFKSFLRDKKINKIIE